MEVESIDEKIEWEVRRVAAAFGVRQWEATEFSHGWQFQGGKAPAMQVIWNIDKETGSATLIFAGVRKRGCQLQKIGGVWGMTMLDSHFDVMARGLYCLGYEESDVPPQLHNLLTSHEKIELRLSMPREFWPQKWLDEEKE